MKTKKGFTLVELLLVVLIISVLAAIVVPRMSGATYAAKVAKCDANWTNMVKALEFWSVEHNGLYPGSAFRSEILYSKRYFPHGQPKCPFGRSYGTYYPSPPYTRMTIDKHNH